MHTAASRPEPVATELQAVLDESGVDVPRLWYAVAGLGGGVGLFEFEAYLHGALVMDRTTRLVAQHAAWELRELAE